MTGTSLIWSALGWGMAALAVVFLLLAFLGDVVRRRFRRMRRCPKCWYDLSHTPGMKCSECGYTAKRERQLFRTRRRKRWVLVALLVWIGSYFAFRVPAMQQRGWVAAVPTTVLVFLSSRWRVSSMDSYHIIDQDQAAGSRWQFRSMTGRLAFEFFHRLEHDALSRWQWTYAIESAIQGAGRQHRWPDAMDDRALHAPVLLMAWRHGRLDDPQEFQRAIESRTAQFATRRRWPVGIPIRACVFGDWSSLDGGAIDLNLGAEPLAPGLRRIDNDDFSFSTASRLSGQRLIERNGKGYPDVWNDSTADLGMPDDPQPPLRFRVSVHQIIFDRNKLGSPIDFQEVDYATDVTVQCEIAGTLADHLDPIRVPEFVAAIEEQLQPSFHDDHIRLPLDDVLDAFALLKGATFAVTLDVMLDDEIVATGEAWWIRTEDSFSGNAIVGPLYRCVRLESLDGAPPTLEPQEQRYRLRIESNPRMALRRFDDDRYWSGEIELPLTWSECKPIW